MVDQSLLRQAADSGVTICFADLDGADGLWVPEERTVLVNRGLSEAKVAEVIEHELAHVMIDDQHADLDAGKEVLVGRPPSRSRRPETVALAAAIGLVAVVGGVMYGVSAARGDVRVAPNPNGPGLTAQESGYPLRPPPPGSMMTRGPNGEVIYVTAPPTPGAPTLSGSPTGSPRASATPTKQAPAPAPVTTVTVPAPAPGTTSAPPAQSTTDPLETTPPPEPTDTPTTPAGGTAGGVGDTGGEIGSTDAAPVGTEPAVADASIAPVDGTTGP